MHLLIQFPQLSQSPLNILAILVIFFFLKEYVSEPVGLFQCVMNVFKTYCIFDIFETPLMEIRITIVPAHSA